MDPRHHPASTVSRDHLHKEWSQLLSKSRKPKDDRPSIDTLRQVGPLYDGVELFMHQYNYDASNIRSEIVTRISKNVSVENFNDQPRSKCGTGWLDDTPPSLSILELGAHNLSDDALDRDTPIPTLSLKSREYPDHLTARDLYSCLQEKRFDHDSLEDVARRLIYIADPDRYDILALTETARGDQKDALHAILWQYYAHETALKVKVPTLSEGYGVFQLELHIHYYSVQRTSLEDLQDDSWKTLHPDWVNLFFLDDHDQDGVLGMHKTQFSLAVGGFDTSQWVAFCFEETRFDEDKEISDDDRGPTWRMDPIAMKALDAKLPLRDPWEYFLAVCRTRLGYVVETMEGLVVRAENSLQEKTSVSTSASMTPEWTEEMLKMLDLSIHNISKLIDQWKSFQAISKDIRYFDDSTWVTSSAHGARIRHVLAALNELLVRMERVEKRFRLIRERCLDLINILEHRLVRRSAQLGQITLLLVGPIIIVASIFSTPPKVVPFERSALSFSLSVIICTLLIGGLLGAQVLLQTLKELIKRLKDLKPRVWRSVPTRNGTDAKSSSHFTPK